MERERSTRSVAVNLFAINAFVYIAMSMYSPYLSAFLTSEGIKPSQVGILLAIGPFAALVIQPLWARLSDSTGKRRLVFSLVALGASMMMLTTYVGEGFWHYFLTIFMYSCFANAIIPLSDAILVSEAHKYHLNYSTLRLGGTIGWTITVYLGGLLMNKHPNYLFALGSLGYLILFILGLCLPKHVDEGERDIMHHQRKKVVVGKGTSGEKGIFKSKEFIFVLGLAFISQLGVNFNASFLGMYVLQIGKAQSTIGLLNAVSSFSEIPILILISRIVKKTGPVKMLFFACFMVVLRLFFVSRGMLPLFICGQAMQGLTYMIEHFCSVSWLYDNVKEGKLSQAQSILAMLQLGLASILGNIFGGRIVESLGLKTAFTTISASVCALTLVILLSYTIYKRNVSKRG
ncbi:MAG: MFS transporter [Lachnospiraceae bacterium]|nr:MFS transporter [Lachnospiraceae bacterium]